MAESLEGFAPHSGNKSLFGDQQCLLRLQAYLLRYSEASTRCGLLSEAVFTSDGLAVQVIVRRLVRIGQ
jgi:hypothetical protein